MKRKYGKYLTMVAFIWAGCAVLFVIANTVFLSPQVKLRKQITAELAEKKQMFELAENASMKENKKRLVGQVEGLRRLLKNFAVDFDGITDLTFDISQVANTRRVSSFSIMPKKQTGDSTLRQCDYISESRLDIRFTAGFNQFAALLNDLERNSPTVFIENFEIVRSEEDDLSHEVDMTLAVFVRKPTKG